MKITPFLLACTLFAADLAQEGDRWWSHIKVLADDNMEGRNTGSPGHKRAALYVAEQFDNAGLLPAGTSGYLQPVEFNVTQIDEPRSSLAVAKKIKGAWTATPLKLGEDAMLMVREGLAPTIDALFEPPPKSGVATPPPKARAKASSAKTTRARRRTT